MTIKCDNYFEDKVYEELHDIYGSEDNNSSTPIKNEDLQRMEYLERVIKETMRILPIVSLIYRTATDDLDIGIVFMIMHNYWCCLLF